MWPRHEAPRMKEAPDGAAKTARPPLWLSLLPLAALMGLLIFNVALFGDDATSGPNQIALLLAAMFAGLIGRFALQLEYRAFEARAIKSIVLAMEAVLILLVVGALIGTWLIGGIVPSMVYYGIKLISPSVFLLVACLVCSVVSLAIGSSWSTMGTVGVALLGIGTALGFPPPLVCGAIISGAYFGDKMSPLSDTTNLAPAVAGTDLFTHIRHMFYTTIPAYTLTVIIFAAIGVFFSVGEYDPQEAGAIVEAIQTQFNVQPYLLLVPAAVILLVALRVPAIPALVVGAVLGGAAALLFQPGQFDGAGGPSWAAAYMRVVTVAWGGFELATGTDVVDTLLSGGGMTGMVSTVLLILMAMLFGGVMEATGMLPRIAEAILHLVRGAGSLIAATIGSCLLFNLTASDQYLAIVIPGRMFRGAYERHRLKPRNLSRALEDGGTVTSVLVPWNTCGAFASGVLAVGTLSYLPFCFFNLLCPVVAITMASLGLAIKRLPEGPAIEEGK